MRRLRRARTARKLSQRVLAARAGVSFRTVQQLEAGRHDPRLSTLTKVASALGYPPRALERALERRLAAAPDSVLDASERVGRGAAGDWKIHLFNFVDAFRRRPRASLVAEPPAPEAPPRVRALFACVVEALCEKAGRPAPDWCAAIGPLPEPWFVSGVESLKAFAIVESPLAFRRRRIFVLENFLERA